MSAFQLDTSGVVHFSVAYAKKHGLLTFYRWSDLSPFEQGYVTGVFESLNVGGSYVGCLQTSFGEIHRCAFSDLHSATLNGVRSDCAAWLGSALHELESPVLDREDFGAAFWARRQAGKLWRFPPQVPFLDDEGRVCLRGSDQ